MKLIRTFHPVGHDAFYTTITNSTENIQQFFGLDKINWKNCVIYRAKSSFPFPS